MGGRVSIFSATSLGGTLSVCGSLVTDVSEETSVWVLAIQVEQARMNKNYIEICKYIEITLHGCRQYQAIRRESNTPYE